MNILGIIPARYGSTRFEGKPLALINGKMMIQRVYEQAKKADKLAEVVVATDDERIYNAVIGFGGKAVMTSTKHRSGTDRCCEVVDKIGKGFDAVINIQGDEPYINPLQINQIAELISDEDTPLASLCKPVHDEDELATISLFLMVWTYPALVLRTCSLCFPILISSDVRSGFPP